LVVHLLAPCAYGLLGQAGLVVQVLVLGVEEGAA